MSLFWDSWESGLRRIVDDFAAIGAWSTRNRSAAQKNLSFVKREERIDDGIVVTFRWVHWDNFCQRQGRLVTLEGTFVKYTHPGAERVNVHDWSNEFRNETMTILVEDAGCRMTRASGAHREEVPPEMLRVAALLRSTGTEPDDPDMEALFASEAGLAPNVCTLCLQGGCPHRCALCGVTAHHDCVVQVVSDSGTHSAAPALFSALPLAMDTVSWCAACLVGACSLAG